jgi:hypothetical protein
MLPGKCNSLPRKKASDYKNSNFQRNTPMRRSSGNETLVEYFVPRSISEFNLTGILNDSSTLTLNQPTGVLRSSNRQSKATNAIEASQTRTRDKMVTFEDDQIAQANNRKAANMEDVFM